MGSGTDINKHKHFHPLTIANIQRLREVEMERAEILRKVNERRAREKEQRSSEEIQAAVAQARPFKGGPERLDWMYQSGAPPPSPGVSAGMASSGVTSSDVAEPAAPLGLSPQDLLEAGRKRRVAESKLREDPLFEIESKKNEFNLGVAAYLSQIQSEKRARKMEKRVRKLEKKEKKKAEKREKKEKKEKSERKLQKKREKKARKQGSVRMEECEEASQRAPSTSSSVC